MNAPTGIKEFTQLKPWWRTEVPTEIVLSANGVDDLLAKLEREGRNPFFIVDTALENQAPFKKIFEQKQVFHFNASESEPRTGDVDKMVTLVKGLAEQPDVLVGVGGGATMDLSKATGICLGNPLPAEKYQGYSLDMNKGTDIWVLPALNGTGAEITPIAVLRGPEKKLGINDPYTEPNVAVIDPQLSSGATTCNRFFTMLDCYYHHFEITHSKTSHPEAIEDAHDGLRLSREVLEHDLSDYSLDRAIKSAMASVLGGSSTIGGRVGASHAISYGLSNSSPKLPHSVAVTISMLAMDDLYPDGYADTIRYLEINDMPRPTAREYGIGADQVEKMTKTALGMEKLWHSYFGDDWQQKATKQFIENIYQKIVKA